MSLDDDSLRDSLRRVGHCAPVQLVLRRRWNPVSGVNDDEPYRLGRHADWYE